MSRLGRFCTTGLLLAACWWGMQAAHEFGHVMNAWFSGGRVTQVVLRPLEISRTDVSPNPHPRFVAWGGPLWGSAFPLVGWLIARRTDWRQAWLLRFFAGLCLVANGAYMLGGSFYPVGDADVLLQHGASRATMSLFGIASIGLGLVLWNRMGPHFGFGSFNPPNDQGLTNELLATSPRFRELVEKSKASPRKPFSAGE